MMRTSRARRQRCGALRIVGFGSYHYTYASGHSGEMCIAGFAPRSGALVVYLGAGIDDEKLMVKLGKHKTGPA